MRATWLADNDKGLAALFGKMREYYYGLARDNAELRKDVKHFAGQVQIAEDEVHALRAAVKERDEHIEELRAMVERAHAPDSKPVSAMLSENA